MTRKFLVPFFAILIAASLLQAQTTLKTLSLSNDFTTVAGTPRVVRNGFNHFWVAAWRQNPSKLMGRIIQSDGSLGATKVLVSGVTAFEGAFDIAYDPVNYTYLLAFETAKGLQVQFFNQSFAKSGQPVLIEGGLSNSTPRLAYDFNGKKFVIIYVGSQDGTPRRVLKSRVLDPQGKPLADAKSLATAAAGKQFGPVSVSTNVKNGNFLVLILHGTSSAAELLGYALKPDGNLLKPAALKVQPNTPGLNSWADAGFADDGTGFVVWADGTSIKYRKISASMALAGGAKSIVSAADSNSSATTLIVDTRNNQYLPTWAKGNQVMSAALNLSSGAVLKPAFTVTGSALTNSRNAAGSYDPSQGNAIVVWEDSSSPASTPSTASTKFRIRAAIFFLGNGGGGGSGNASVSVGDNFFSPAQITVQPGTTVKWTWNGNNPHTVSSSTGAFGSNTLNHGGTFEFRFTDSGTFNYFCQVHGQSMSGTVTVQNATEPPPHY